MKYLKCVRCGLEVRAKPARVQIENCPRCLARAATMSPMVATTPTATRSAGAARRASQAALAASVRNLRSPRHTRSAR